MKTPFNVSIILLAGLFLCSSVLAASEKISIDNALISVTVDTENATFSVTDKRTEQTWRQKSLAEVEIIQSAKISY